MKMDKKEMAEVLKRFVDSLPEEQKQEAKTFKTVDELVGFASDAGIALPDELMDVVAGGKSIPTYSIDPVIPPASSK